MREPVSWRCVAYNQATESENKIHDDSVARRYGFRGGLVPGVTVYAYLVHPAIEAWGLDWLSRGSARIVLAKPVYEGDEVRVEPKPDGPGRYRGQVIDPQGAVCAEGDVALPDDGAGLPVRRGDSAAPAPAQRPEATREALEQLRLRGLGSLRGEWSGRYRYTPSENDVPELVRPGGGGYANAAFALGLANGILSANVRLGPWIHVESEVRNRAAIPLGSRLTVEGRVVDLFARGGHEFVDLDVEVFIEPERPALSVRHRAIYKLRAA
ncbi:MAG: hypothetical protein V3V67_18340 [Myxococcota bacterium]